MLRNLICIAVVALLATPALVRAEFQKGDFELTLAGQGANDKDFETGSASVNVGVGWFLTNDLEFAVRQGIIWADGGSAWGGNTSIASDWHFDFGRSRPFIGANIGYQYGETTADAWNAGPEGGVKYFLNSTTFIQGIVTYEFNLNDGFDSGAYTYGLGLGVRL